MNRNLTSVRARRLARISLLASALLGANSHAQTTTPTEDEEIVELSPFVVDSAGDQGYGTSAGLGGTRVNRALIDTSMAITNVNKEFIEDIGLTQLSDLVTFVSGMSSTGAQADGRYSSRGRQSSGSNFRDGMPEAFGVNSTEQVDGALFDRIEVVKGPAGVLFGSMDIGGTVNRISKRPLPKDKTTLGVSYNTLGTVRGEVDMSRVLYSSEKGKLAMRVAGALQDGQSDDSSLDNRIAFNPSLKYDTNRGDSIWLYFLFQNVESGTRDTIPADKSGKLFPFMDPGYPLFQDTSPRWDNRRIYEVGYTKKFEWRSMDGGFRIVTRYLNNDQDRANSANGNYRVYDPAGAFLGLNSQILWDDVTVGRLDWSGLIKSEQWVANRGGSVNADFSANFDLLGGKNSFFTYFEGVKLETTNFILQSGTPRPEGYERWPNWELPPDWGNWLDNPASNTAVNGNTLANSTNIAFAAQDNLSYFDNSLIFTAGTRYDRGEVKSRNFRTAGAPLVITSSGNWSTKFGVVIKPLRNKGVALFYNHSDTFRPVTSIDSNTSSPTYGEKFPDQTGLSDEIGLKFDMFKSKLVGSIVYFDSALTNQLITVVAPDGNDIRQPVAEVTTKGIEFDLSAKISSSLTTLISFSDLTALTTNGVPLRGNPQQTFALMAKYTFQNPTLKGLSIASGYRFAGERAGDNNGSFYTPDMELYNLSVIYKRDNWRAQMSIDNLMDSTEVTGSINVARLGVYNKRNVTFKFSRSF